MRYKTVDLLVLYYPLSQGYRSRLHCTPSKYDSWLQEQEGVGKVEPVETFLQPKDGRRLVGSFREKRSSGLFFYVLFRSGRSCGVSGRYLCRSVLLQPSEEVCGFLFPPTPSQGTDRNTYMIGVNGHEKWS